MCSYSLINQITAVFQKFKIYLTTFCLFLVCVFIVFEAAWAQPSSDIRWLMGENASLFDLGMMDLEKRAAEQARRFRANKKVGLSESEVEYDYDQNLIFVRIRLLTREDATPTNCLGFLTPLRVHMSGAGERFGHSGYRQKNRPRSLTKNINNMVRLEIHLSTNLTKKKQKRPIVCRAALE